MPILFRVYYWIFLAYFSILPLANTTGLRNIFLFTLVCLFFYFIFSRTLLLGKDLELHEIPASLIFWCCFLVFFPLWAEQSDLAWKNLGGQWGQSIFAWCVGIGAAKILGPRGPSLWGLAIASTLPIFIHLSLTLLAWSGALGVNIPDTISIDEIWSCLIQAFDFSSREDLVPHNFPWGFRGYDPMHGNLGYAACQAIVLFVVCSVVAWQKGQQFRFWIAAIGITLCFLSVLIASSRGAVFFGVIMLTGAFFSILLRNIRKRTKNRKSCSGRCVFKAFFGVLILLAFFATFAAKIVNNDVRWRGVVDKISVGFDIENPIDFLCNGLSVVDQEKIIYKYKDKLPSYSEELISSLNSDGGRVVLTRAGFSLIAENLRGIDGSRSTYERLIEKKCGHPPVMHFAHTHQAWMDIVLALGLVGAILLGWVFISFMLKGWHGIMGHSFDAWAFALFLMSLFWILRGFMDSVYREHYLQMQAAVISYLYFKQSKSSNS
ncbi:O-antigen ligase [Rhodoferax sp. U11-2br]|uniref:O-antigen ligase family protein n=1 Tax=Rhodoferax sp. U11-2br TaxID=2838878 RepID=UPI001BE747DB|nr:O-antigen ligase family protein [Rhodoferax sp. U11-2br]MBT3065253.1 hypothetical protein [Rhodoferax sp. U11-2br]